MQFPGQGLAAVRVVDDVVDHMTVGAVRDQPAGGFAEAAESAAAVG